MAVYYPFMGFPLDFAYETGHEELFFNGYIPSLNLEDFPVPPHSAFTDMLPHSPDPRNEWLKKVWGLLKELEDQGMNWIWVNDEYLKEAEWKQDKMYLGATNCQVLLLPEIPMMEIEAAQKVAALADSGAKVITYGQAPLRAKGYYQSALKD